MGSVSGGGSASRERFSENSWQNALENFFSNTNQNRQGSRSATFDSPEGQKTLGFLTDQATSGGGFQQQAGNTFNTLANLRGEVNPEVENIIKSTNQEANTNFNNRLAQSRAGGFRGGTGANLYSQDKVASEFTNKQAGENAALRYGAFNDAQNRTQSANVAGASGLASLAGQNQGLAAQLLSLLRGESTQDATQSSTTGQSSTEQVGGRSGKKSGTGMSIEGSYNYM